MTEFDRFPIRLPISLPS